MLFSMHASVMIFFVIIPLLTGAFGNFLIPLMIGARDMAFPKLNMMSYWFMWPAFVIILAQLLRRGGARRPRAGPPIRRWPAPPCRPARACNRRRRPTPGMGRSSGCSALLFVGISSMMGSVNYITTIINMRAPGMTLYRMPMTIWAMFITAILQAFALPVLTVALILQAAGQDHRHRRSSCRPTAWTSATGTTGPGGGQPLLWQHLFWFYSHPAVYIMILPAMGMVSDIISTFARRPLFGYRAMIYSIAGIAGLGFIVWGHHMFQSGMDPRLGTGFMLATIMIALPSAVKVFNWLGTVFMGNIQYTTADAVRPGVRVAVHHRRPVAASSWPPRRWTSTSTTPISSSPTFTTCCSPAACSASSRAFISGSRRCSAGMMNETLGKVHFAITFIAANCVFFPMHILGVGRACGGASPTSPRRCSKAQLLDINRFMSISAFVLGAAQIIFVVNFFWSLFRGKVAGRNPWHSNSLEWTAPSPPPHGNFDIAPVVYRWAYDYGDYGEHGDHLGQTLKLTDEDAHKYKSHDH